MTTGAKIAIGCGLARAGRIVVVAAFGGRLVAQGQGRTRSPATRRRIDELHEQANVNTFVRPADGAHPGGPAAEVPRRPPARLDVYKKHRADMEATSKKEQGDLSDLTEGFR